MVLQDKYLQFKVISFFISKYIFNSASSVLSTLHRSDQAILNISTSAQLAFVMRDGFEPKSKPNKDDDLTTETSIGHVEYFPYFQGKYLAVAAALTGGNALAAFVRMLQQWAIELGANVPQCKH